MATYQRNMGRKMSRFEGMCTHKMFAGVHMRARLLETHVYGKIPVCVKVYDSGMGAREWQADENLCVFLLKSSVDVMLGVQKCQCVSVQGGMCKQHSKLTQVALCVIIRTINVCVVHKPLLKVSPLTQALDQ